jgi:hypothetical protein
MKYIIQVRMVSLLFRYSVYNLNNCFDLLLDVLKKVHLEFFSTQTTYDVLYRMIVKFLCVRLNS